MDSAIAVAGTLAGVLLGGLVSFFTQRAVYKREALERLAAVRRETYLEFLSAVHQMFVAIQEIQRQVRDGSLDASAASERLRSVPSHEAQNALENLRLVSSGSVAAAAARLWERMRRDDAPMGRNVTWRSFADWRHTYWGARRALVDSARQDTGFDALDWATAGLP